METAETNPKMQEQHSAHVGFSKSAVFNQPADGKNHDDDETGSQGTGQSNASVSAIGQLRQLNLGRDEEDYYLNSAVLPADTRVVYTRRLWVLLTLEMWCMVASTLIIWKTTPDGEGMHKDTLMTLGFITRGVMLLIFILLLILFCVKDIYPCNYIIGFPSLLAMMTFFGICKYFMPGVWHLHYLGLIATSLTLSTFCYWIGLTSKLGVNWEEKYDNYITEAREAEFAEMIEAADQVPEFEEKNGQCDIAKCSPVLKLERHGYDCDGSSYKYTGEYIRMPLPYNGHPCYIKNDTEINEKAQYMYWNKGWIISPKFGSQKAVLFLKDAPQCITPAKPYPYQWQLFNKERKTWTHDNNKWSVTIPDANRSRLRRLVATSEVVASWRINDGMMKSTLFLGIINWILAVVLDWFVVHPALFSDITDKMQLGGAAFFSFFFSLFFHMQIERQMRQCKLGEFTTAIFAINAEILLTFGVLCLLCCNLREEGGNVQEASEGEGEKKGGGADIEAMSEEDLPPLPKGRIMERL